MSVIQLAGIERVFHLGDSVVHALSGLNVVIEPGEYVAIMGASGSGKSTLMHIIGCLDVGTTGRYLLDGLDVSALDEFGLDKARRWQIR